ncbi:outer membrane protein assembly factor BamB family protein [Roseitranquillus sediminis]|uniref:outer membrane protein assembly factor BamB family protein n=1 Tax=Roseitranquillus sediminis TaxID=2809051 RepID=UPI001D0C16C5|nr:PQQ-binding-like beta-propeller repeat protein [Roseitranquillus sediminis]MBM9594357.1 PQQ-binding-like beta-propeller repeat protein [Roseitranquillus sediminis]
MRRAACLTVLALLALAGCGGDEILPGERLELRPEREEPVASAGPLSLAPPQALASWTHKAGQPDHDPPHAALSASLTRVWSVDIGQGAGRQHRIGADPVVDGGRVFTLDSRARVAAHSTGGAQLWARDLTPRADRSGDASGGGLAATGGRVFVTTGFGKLLVLDASNGRTLWEQDLDAVATGAPTVVGDIVYAVSRDSRGWALDVETGRVLWQLSGVPSAIGVDGGASPAVDERLALFPMASGELVAALRQGGTRVWTAPITGRRAGRAYAVIDDITGDPVIAGDRVVVGNPSGRTVTLDATSGERLWTAREGAMSPPVVTQNAVFVVSDTNELVRLDAVTGARVWAAELPGFVNQRLRRRKAVHAHYGPVLAGGRLIVASDDRVIRSFDPATGALVATAELPGGAASNPAIAGGTLYVVTRDGRLHAYR